MSVSPTASAAALREVSGCVALIALLMLFAAGKAVLHDTMDPDFFWHIRVAQQLQQEGVKPIVDQISFASDKTPWSPYSWLGELGMKWVWDHTGLRGAVFLQAILEAVFILIVVGCAIEGLHRRDEPIAPLMPIVLATALGTFLALPYLSFRPVLGAIDLLGICSYLILRDRHLLPLPGTPGRGQGRGARNATRPISQLAERRCSPLSPTLSPEYRGEGGSRAIWVVPILTAITINLHIFALFVPMFVGALTLGAWIERDKLNFKRYAILLAACILACCCTPMLRGTLGAIGEYATANPVTRTSMIVELEPMYRGLIHQITLVVVLAILVFVVAKRRLCPGEWLWLGGMLLVWIKCGRGAPIFVPIFAFAMSSAIPRLSDHVLGKKWVNLAVASLLLIGTIRIGFALPSNDRIEAWLNRRGDDLPGYPTAAAEFVESSVHRSTGKLINEFDWGGYLAWKLPGYQILLDGRTQLYSPDFWRATYLSDARETRQFLRTIQADAAILPVGRSRFRESLTQLGWKSVYHDKRSEVLLPPETVANSGEQPNENQ